MREIKDEDLPRMNQIIGKLSVDMAKGNIKNAKELAKLVDGVMSSEELVFATTLLIIERYSKIANTYVGMKQKEKLNDEMMFG